MRGVTVGSGATAATFAAGPSFVIIGMAVDYGTEPVHPFGVDGLGVIIIFLPFASLFGVFLAFLPIVAGASLLGAVGRNNAGVRLPAFYMLAGAGAGASIGTVGGAAGAAVMATVGTICALICRWGTHWQD